MEKTIIKFWSGSRTTARRNHERDVLEAVLNQTMSEYGTWEFHENTDDYHGNIESGTFRKFGHDVFATIAGNKKMEKEHKIVVYKPIMKGILGYRILIIREKDRALFAEIQYEDDLKQYRMGIPETWSDADFYRYNGYKVEEKGSFDDLFERLHNQEFDFTALGANEIEDVFHDKTMEVNGLAMVDHLLIHFPFPVLFYVNPDMPTLAKRIEKGMSLIEKNGQLNEIFMKYNAACIQRLNLKKRIRFDLKNPILPKELIDFECII